VHAALKELTNSIPDLADLVRIFGRLTVALIIGAAVGLQRSITHKPAGVRTHMLVALGTALLLVTASDAGLSNSDLSRIVQGIITGIGFLGGGAILKLTQEHEIHGLTSAAGIWLTAGASAAAGLGQITAALIGLAMGLVVLRVVGQAEKQQAQSRPGKRGASEPQDD
jgi:putative Mg2+ transporter-C (MgtC) family protein